MRGTEPGKEGGEVCARPLLPEDPVFESGVRVGWWRGGGARGRLSAFRPEEERLDPKKVTKAPLGTLGTLGLRAALDPYASPGFQGTRVLAGRGCWARGLGPPAFRASPGSGKDRHVVGSVLPPSPASGPPPLLDQVQARAPRRCCPLAAPSHPPPLFRTISLLHSSFVSFPPLSFPPPLLPFPTGGRLGVRLRSPVRPKHFHRLQRPPPACSRVRPRSPSRQSLCSPKPHSAGS